MGYMKNLMRLLRLSCGDLLKFSHIEKRPTNGIGKFTIREIRLSRIGEDRLSRFVYVSLQPHPDAPMSALAPDLPSRMEARATQAIGPQTRMNKQCDHGTRAYARMRGRFVLVTGMARVKNIKRALSNRVFPSCRGRSAGKTGNNLPILGSLPPSLRFGDGVLTDYGGNVRIAELFYQHIENRIGWSREKTEEFVRLVAKSAISHRSRRDGRKRDVYGTYRDNPDRYTNFDITAYAFQCIKNRHSIDRRAYRIQLAKKQASKEGLSADQQNAQKRGYSAAERAFIERDIGRLLLVAITEYGRSYEQYEQILKSQLEVLDRSGDVMKLSHSLLLDYRVQMRSRVLAYRMDGLDREPLVPIEDA